MIYRFLYFTFDLYMVNLAINDLSCTNNFIVPVISLLLVCATSSACYITLNMPYTLNSSSHVPLLHSLCHWYACSATVTHVVSLLASFVPMLHDSTHALYLECYLTCATATLVPQHVHATWFLPCPIHWMLLDMCHSCATACTCCMTLTMPCTLNAT